MDITKFFAKLESKGWNINKTPVVIADTKIDSLAEKRFSKVSLDFLDFISSFSECTSKDETMWVLSYLDYRCAAMHDIAFSWDWCESQSIEYSDKEDHHTIHSFWNNHIPFVMSVSGEYSYIAICINDENFGKIYQGNDPDYEDTTLIAPSLSEFLNSFLTDYLL